MEKPDDKKATIPDCPYKYVCWKQKADLVEALNDAMGRIRLLEDTYQVKTERTNFTLYEKAIEGAYPINPFNPNLYKDKKKINQSKICKCECHVKGMDVLHFMACCQFTGEKYINIDGTIDLEAYQKLLPNSPLPDIHKETSQ